MQTKLDKIDLGIIDSLIEDGRKSLRQIAREIKVSTPSVETRLVDSDHVELLEIK